MNVHRFAPVGEFAQELVRFDMQRMDNAEIKGVEYQQGTLAGLEVKEYLLQKWSRTCVYCGADDKPLEVEHIEPRSGRGMDRVSNLTLACTRCNQKKSNKPIEVFLAKKPEVLNKAGKPQIRPLRPIHGYRAGLASWRFRPAFRRRSATESGLRIPDDE